MKMLRAALRLLLPAAALLAMPVMANAQPTHAASQTGPVGTLVPCVDPSGYPQVCVLQRTILADASGNPYSAGGASELHIGEVGGNQATITVAQTVTASAYTAGNALGGLMTLANASRVSGGSGLFQSVVMTSKATLTSANAATDVFIFNANPTSSTCTDKTAFALATADLAKLIGVVHLTDTTAAGTPTIVQGQTQAMPFVLSGTTAYACAVVRGTPTPASTSDIALTFNILRN